MLPHFIVTRPLSPVMVFGVLLSFATKCNPFFLSGPAQLCEGPVFPTAIMLCNGTSVGTLTAYTSKCAKHNFGNRLRRTFARPPFYYSTFPIFICYQKAVSKIHQTTPPIGETLHLVILIDQPKLACLFCIFVFQDLSLLAHNGPFCRAITFKHKAD